MKNPFVYGPPVSGNDFVDRDDEIHDIMKELRSGKSLVLFSIRRMGKSSLLLELMRRYRKEFLFVYVDLYGTTSKNQVLQSFASAVVNSAHTKIQRASQAVHDLLKTLSFRVVMTPVGTIGLEFGSRELEPAETLQVLDLAERVAKKRNKRVIVIFDEFQEICPLDGVTLLKAMRSRFQMHRKVTYVFSGSKRHLLLGLFEETEGAFYHFAKPVELGPMPRDVYERLLVDKFRSQGGEIGPESIAEILYRSRGSPYVVQHLAHELFRISRRPKFPQDVNSAVKAAIRSGAPAYSMVWDSIKSSLQRRYLLAAAAEPDVPHGVSFIERYGLKSTSHVQKVIKNLDAKGITEGGAIVDPIFILWLNSMSERPSSGA